jgi:hypothetical protein
VTEAQDHLVDRYLRQSRILRKATTSPAVHREHLRFLEDVLRRLGPEGPATRPRLHLTSTANAVVETVSFSQGCGVVYDYDFGVAMHRLNEFVFGEWPDDHVLSWGLEHLAVSFVAAGEMKSALAALTGSVFLRPSSQPPTDQSALNSAAGCVLIQDYFTIAHECVHLALDDGRLVRLAEAHHEDVVQVMSELRERDADSAEIAASLRSAATSALGGDEALSRRNYPDLLLRLVAGSLSIDELKAGQPHLEEELLCDAAATDLTISALAPEFGEEAVIMAILFGLSNLRSLEFARSLGRTEPPSGKQANAGPLGLGAFSTDGAAAYRLSVWRRWACTSRALPSETLHPALRRMSESYAEAVGDPVLLALSPRFHEGYEMMQSGGMFERRRAGLMTLLSKGADVDVLARIFKN